MLPSALGDRRIIVLALMANVALLALPAAPQQACPPCFEWDEYEGKCVEKPGKETDCPYCCKDDAWAPLWPNACEHECVDGTWVKKLGANGCSNPFGPNEWDKVFDGCCNQHDRCYDTCEADKKACDNTFKDCMKAKCNSFSGKQKGKCMGAAFIRYAAVRLGGKKNFDAAQKCCSEPGPCA